MYAALLCRAALGSVERTSEDWYDEEITEDSRLAEPEGEAREFILSDAVQVYPEYAILYEALDEALYV